MSTVWVITEGSYSDYKILAVYDTEQAAREYFAEHGDAIETWKLNTPNGQETHDEWRVSAVTGMRGPNGDGWKDWHIRKPMRRST